MTASERSNTGTRTLTAQGRGAAMPRPTNSLTRPQKRGIMTIEPAHRFCIQKDNMETYIVTCEATDIVTDNVALAKVGDPWTSARPLVVTHNHYGDGIDLSITKRYPDGVVPVEDLATGAVFRVTVERIEEMT